MGAGVIEAGKEPGGDHTRPPVPAEIDTLIAEQKGIAA